MNFYLTYLLELFLGLELCTVKGVDALSEC